MDSKTSSVIMNYRIVRTSQWEQILKKHSQSTPAHCKPKTSVDMPRMARSVKQFPTGSEYEGTWDVLGMSGRGRYTFPNGVIYNGELSDGMFHGAGELCYPSGAVVRGRWRQGELVERTLTFADGLEYREKDWTYCTMPDRRFTVEYKRGLQPAGATFLSAEQPTPELPKDCYDTVDGFYDPKLKVVMNPADQTEVLRAPSKREQLWIEENCRRERDEPCGPRADLYEEWSDPKNPPKKQTPATLLTPAGAPATATTPPVPETEYIFDDDALFPESCEACVYGRPRKRIEIPENTEKNIVKFGVVGESKQSELPVTPSQKCQVRLILPEKSSLPKSGRRQ